jgi:uncharacterized protein
MKHQTIIDATRRWIETIVIGLNFCPFARRVFDANLIRFVVSDARDDPALLDDLAAELQLLAAAPISQVETTLLIHPYVLLDFLDYNDFLFLAEQQIDTLGLEGIVQVASFHPRYQFADTAPDALENFTTRSPYPMLHLLREDSVTAVADRPEELAQIPTRNIETLHRLGREKLLALLKSIESDTRIVPQE